MSDVVNELLTYVNTGEISPQLSCAKNELDQQDFRLAAINLFRLLRRQLKFEHERPFELRGDPARILPRLLGLCPSLSELFEIHDNDCNFRQEVPNGERARLRELVVEKYRPVPKPRRARHTLRSLRD